MHLRVRVATAAAGLADQLAAAEIDTSVAAGAVLAPLLRCERMGLAPDTHVSAVALATVRITVFAADSLALATPGTERTIHVGPGALRFASF